MRGSIRCDKLLSLLWDNNNMIKFPDSAFAFLGSKNNQHLLIPNRNYLIWCAQIHRISYVLLALFWQKSQIIFWDTLYTYCSCPAKGLAVCPWPQKMLLMTQVLCRTPQRQGWLTSSTKLHPPAIWPGGKGKKWLLLCPEGRSWGPGAAGQQLGSMSKQKKSNSWLHVWDNTDRCCLQDMQRKANP